MTSHYKIAKYCKDTDIAPNRGMIQSITALLGKTRKKNQQNDQDMSQSPIPYRTQDPDIAIARHSNRQTKQVTQVMDGHANREIKGKRKMTRHCTNTHPMPTIKEDEKTE
eukprot:3747018-Ditylum_brightwellii.AAC.1